MEAYKSALEATGQTGDQVWLSLDQKIKTVQRTVTDLTVTQQEYTGTFVEGMDKALKQYTQDAPTAFQAGATVAKSVTADMERDFTTFFNHTSKGFLNFHDLAVSLCNDIENALIKTLLVHPLVASLTGAVSGYNPNNSMID